MLSASVLVFLDGLHLAVQHDESRIVRYSATAVCTYGLTSAVLIALMELRKCYGMPTRILDTTSHHRAVTWIAGLSSILACCHRWLLEQTGAF